MGGACVSVSDPVVCTAADQCHLAGTCAPATGVCPSPNAANGTTCNDGNARPRRVVARLARARARRPAATAVNTERGRAISSRYAKRTTWQLLPAAVRLQVARNADAVRIDRAAGPTLSRVQTLVRPAARSDHRAAGAIPRAIGRRRQRAGHARRGTVHAGLAAAPLTGSEEPAPGGPRRVGRAVVARAAAVEAAACRVRRRDARTRRIRAARHDRRARAHGPGDATRLARTTTGRMAADARAAFSQVTRQTRLTLVGRAA